MNVLPAFAHLYKVQVLRVVDGEVIRVIMQHVDLQFPELRFVPRQGLLDWLPHDAFDCLEVLQLLLLDLDLHLWLFLDPYLLQQSQRHGLLLLLFNGHFSLGTEISWLLIQLEELFSEQQGCELSWSPAEISLVTSLLFTLMSNVLQNSNTVQWEIMQLGAYELWVILFATQLCYSPRLS